MTQSLNSSVQGSSPQHHTCRGPCDYKSIMCDGSETCLLSPPLLLLLLSLSPTAGEKHWRTAQSLCPSDTQMGSSQTATAATESKWQSRNTWRQSLGKGIDRELETKDAGWHICSILPSQPEKQNKNKKNLSVCRPRWNHFEIWTISGFLLCS